VTEAEIDRALAGLDKIGTDASGWCSLYRDRVSGDLWEISYPHSEMHGGGPRSLARISPSDARARYPSAISN